MNDILFPDEYPQVRCWYGPNENTLAEREALENLTSCIVDFIKLGTFGDESKTAKQQRTRDLIHRVRDRLKPKTPIS